MNDVTRVLNAIEKGDSRATHELLPLVYAELRRLASGKMAQERPGQTLNATALVHEAYLRLVDGAENRRWDSRGHFFAAAAEAMRRILIENVRRRRSIKRGGGRARQELVADVAAAPESMDEDSLLDLNDALVKLATTEPELARLVELRYFAGLSVEEAASAMGISTRTAKRNWSYARAWIKREMDRE
jgi:RNA polymerase sigma factor (TIGR02999 family)